MCHRGGGESYHALSRKGRGRKFNRQDAEKLAQVGAAIGLSINDMVKVFVRRTIAAGGLPFDMKMAANGARADERTMPVFGQLPALLAEVAANAAREAALGHIESGRLPDTRKTAPR